jgi:hypothetical protein
MGITVGKSYDRSAAEFFNAAQTLTVLQKQAVNTLVTDLKIYNLWDKMKAIYPMVGQAGISGSFSYNLKDINTFRGTFSSTGWTFSSTGAKPNGTSAYMDTGLNPSIALNSINNVHLSMYSRTQNSSVSGHNMGVDTTDSLNLSQYFASVSVKLFMNGGYPNNSAEFNQTNTLGLAIGSAISSTSRKLYFNGSLLNTDTNSQTTGLPNRIMLIGCGTNASGVLSYFTPHENSFSSIGDGLTDTDASNLYTAVQRFQTTLGRQV